MPNTDESESIKIVLVVPILLNPYKKETQSAARTYYSLFIFSYSYLDTISGKL